MTANGESTPSDEVKATPTNGAVALSLDPVAGTTTLVASILTVSERGQ